MLYGKALEHNVVPDLKEECVRLGLATNGLKVDLIARLRLAVAGGAVLLVVKPAVAPAAAVGGAGGVAGGGIAGGVIGGGVPGGGVGGGVGGGAGGGVAGGVAGGGAAGVGAAGGGAGGGVVAGGVAVGGGVAGGVVGGGAVAAARAAFMARNIQAYDEVRGVALAEAQGTRSSFNPWLQIGVGELVTPKLLESSKHGDVFVEISGLNWALSEIEAFYLYRESMHDSVRFDKYFQIGVSPGLLTDVHIAFPRFGGTVPFYFALNERGLVAFKDALAAAGMVVPFMEACVNVSIPIINPVISSVTKPQEASIMTLTTMVEKKR